MKLARAVILNYVKNAKMAIFRCLKNHFKIRIELQKSLQSVLCKLPDDPESLKSLALKTFRRRCHEKTLNCLRDIYKYRYHSSGKSDRGDAEPQSRGEAPTLEHGQGEALTML